MTMSAKRPEVVRARLVTLAMDRPAKQAFLRGFGKRLRSRRTAAKLSQEGLAARCFIGHGRITEFENGHAMPDLEMLLLLGDALRVSVAELTDGLAVPARRAARAGILGLVEREPANRTQELAKSAGVPYSYVFQIVRYLEAYGEIERHGGRWQLRRGGGKHQSDSIALEGPIARSRRRCD